MFYRAIFFAKQCGPPDAALAQQCFLPGWTSLDGGLTMLESFNFDGFFFITKNYDVSKKALTRSKFVIYEWNKQVKIVVKTVKDSFQEIELQ